MVETIPSVNILLERKNEHLLRMVRSTSLVPITKAALEILNICYFCEILSEYKSIGSLIEWA